MLLRWLALLMLLPSVSAYSYEFPIEIFEYVDNAKIVTFINEGDIVDAVNWEPFKGSPPLSPEKAMASIHNYIGGKKEFSNIKLEEVELRRIPHHEKQWHYMFKMKTHNNDKTQYHYFVVLMSGKIISALKVPESFK